MIEGWVEQKFKEFGLQNVNRQYFTLTPQFFPTNWSLTATGGGKTVVDVRRTRARRPAARRRRPRVSISIRCGSGSAPRPTSRAAT